MAIKIAFCNQKGGVAKTTSCLNVACCLAQAHKVLLIDLDPQSSLSISLGYNLTESMNTMYSVMCQGKNIEQMILMHQKNLFLAPASIELALADLQLVNEMARESVLKKALQEVEEQFDYILIDCPPSLGLLVVNALNASDTVLIPCATDYLSYRGLKLLSDTVEKVRANLNENLDILGVIATFYDKRTLHSKEVLELLEKDYPILGTVSVSVQAKDSILDGKSLIEYNPRHKISQEYQEIAKRIREMEVKNYEKKCKCSVER